MIATPLSSPRQSLVALTAFLGVLIGTVVWSIMLDNSGLQSQFELKSQMMDRLRAPTGVGSRNNGSARFLAADMVNAASTDTLAASGLHKRILAFLDEAGGSVHSIQAEVTNDVVEGGLRRLNAQITFDSSVETLQKLLFALETAVPFIFVDSLVVQPVLASTTSTNVGDRLRVTLVASSYWKASATATKP
jgi:Type II secretion system (T2SS), protein M subtype b